MPEEATVPRIQRPDVADFRRRFEIPRQPVVITGAIDHWKAIGRWSPDYFAEHLGNEKLPVSICEEEPPEGGPVPPELLMKSKIVKMLIKDYLAEMATGSRKTYVPGMPLKSNLPMLLDDIDTPPYREEGSTASPRIWFGSRVIGPLHYDPTNNLFSTIPQMSQASINQPDYARFPRLRKAAPLIADLAPGDLLFLPAGWWHQVTTPTPTISIDFPWQKNDAAFARPFLRLIPCKVLRKIRGRIGYGA